MGLYHIQILYSLQRAKLKGAHERSKTLHIVENLDSKSKTQQEWLE